MYALEILIGVIHKTFLQFYGGRELHTFCNWDTTYQEVLLFATLWYIYIFECCHRYVSIGTYCKHGSEGGRVKIADVNKKM